MMNWRRARRNSCRAHELLCRGLRYTLAWDTYISPRRLVQRPWAAFVGVAVIVHVAVLCVLSMVFYLYVWRLGNPGCSWHTLSRMC